MKRFILACAVGLLFFIPHEASSAQTPNQPSYSKGTVEKVVKIEEDKITQEVKETVAVRLTESGKNVTIPYQFSEKTRQAQELHQGDSVIVMSQIEQKQTYSIYDKFRSGNIIFIALAFSILILLMTGFRGLGSLLGLFISFAVITFFIVPFILKGADPLFISIVGSIFIMVTTIYLAHGFSQRTTIAIASTFLSLVITGILAVWFVSALGLTGSGNEDAYMLQFGAQVINLKGLLLGGIIIGTLGVLDDTTTTQAATVFTLSEANSKLKAKELMQKGFVVGKEHITSLVNTLVLAYAGASLPLFIFFVLNPMHQPLWVIFNNEMVVEEIVRTLAGSIGLILAVPITTVMAAFFAKYSLKLK